MLDKKRPYSLKLYWVDAIHIPKEYSGDRNIHNIENKFIKVYLRTYSVISLFKFFFTGGRNIRKLFYKTNIKAPLLRLFGCKHDWKYSIDGYPLCVKCYEQQEKIPYDVWFRAIKLNQKINNITKKINGKKSGSYSK